MTRTKLNKSDRKLFSIWQERYNPTTLSYRMLFGSARLVPGIVHRSDGERQFDRWDHYVREEDKPFLRTPHCETTLLLAFLVAIVHTASSTVTGHERRYKAAALLRDFINSALSLGTNEMCGLPVGSQTILPLQGCKISQTREFLATFQEGIQLMHWWHAVVAEDIVLPAAILSNPVTGSV